MNTIPITILYRGILLKGYAGSIQSLQDAFPVSLKIYMQGWYLGTLNYNEEKWSMDQPIDPKFVEEVGRYIFSYMQSIKKAMHYNADK